MRKLNTRDCFKMFRIIKHADLKSKLEGIAGNLASMMRDGTGKEKVGLEIIMLLLDSMADSKTEEMVYDLLNDVTGEDASQMELAYLVEVFKEIADQNNIVSFFKQAVSLAKS